ncbi:MAG: DUF4147 domain-containing protein [Candidatus Diapherotrites archaeon]|nr:DUF4147 domain-containing protein [Candidatus Diapherotrites archaeon]
MNFENRTKLESSNSRKKVLELLETGIQRVLPENALKGQISFNEEKKELIIQGKKFSVKGRIFVIGAGKASSEMAKAVEEILGTKNIEAGIINCNMGFNLTKKIEIHKASHPVPDENGLIGTKKMLELKEKYSINENDLILCLMSGGGSSFMVAPQAGITLEELIKTNQILVKEVSEIHKINTIRKHYSKVKGGKLAQFFAPAKIISLIISDVIGDDLSFIASGPSVQDKTTFADALKIIQESKIEEKLPSSVYNYIKNNAGKTVNETPKQLTNSFPFLIATNKQALKAMQEKASELGLNAVIDSDTVKGNSQETAEKIALMISSEKTSFTEKEIPEKPCVILMGGETTVKITGKAGKGGRNQELSLRVLNEIHKLNQKNKFVFASIGTDGADFIDDAAGGIIDSNSMQEIKEKKLDLNKFIENHDSFNLLTKINGLLATGKTGTNTCDLMILLIE